MFKPIRNWRIVGETLSGAYCFFDPSREVISVRDLTSAEIHERIECDRSESAPEQEREADMWLPIFSNKDEVPF